MKKYVAAFALLFAMTACCGQNDKPLEGTVWKLTEMEGIPASAIESEADAFTIQFNAEDQMVAGRTNCNRFFGSYVAEGETLAFGNMGMTRMACPDMQFEDLFVKMLNEVDGVKVKGEEMSLLHAGKPVAKFRAMPAEAVPAQ